MQGSDVEAKRKCEMSAEGKNSSRAEYDLRPLKTVTFLVSAQGSNVEASEACIYELIDSLSERDA